MSIHAVAWAIKTRVGDPALKVLLISIANYADENNRAWPSQKRLAYDTEISERSIRRKLVELEELKLISIEARRHPSGEVATSVITLNTSGQFDRKQEPPAKTDSTSGQNRGSPAANKVSASKEEPSRTIREEEPSDSPSLSLGCTNTQFSLKPCLEVEVLSEKESAELFFDKQFWPAYPKRFGSNPKEPAKKKIVAAILKGEKSAEILAGVNRLYTSLERTGKIGTEFVPMALTWINRKSWKDDPLPAGNGKSKNEKSFFDIAQESYLKAEEYERENGTGTDQNRW